ncbi:MAG: cysteine hydrolase [Bacteroidales bacterium]|nr:cysteine hydrolase [Bacteroidales bacterium]MCF8391087.1 cysteine hydrolase [Bacteroidales bacterium]
MRILILLFTMLVITTSIAFSQTEKKALILIDIQEFYFNEEKMPLVGNLEATETALKILEYFRENNLLIIHVRHKGGGEIHELVKPVYGEIIIEKTQVNAFRETDLLKILKENMIENLVLLGMQTQMCLEAATRAGADYGFNCIVIHDACATRDLEFNGHITSALDVHYSTLNTLKSYAKILSADEFLNQ